MRKVCTSRFDLEGSSFFRATKLCVLNKFLPIGNFMGGPGLRPALVLLLLNSFGGQIFKVITRFERYFHRFYQFVKKTR